MQNYKSPPTGNIGENLGDLGFGHYFLYTTPKALWCVKKNW